jgi:redox-sensitive bicupin YhaK (pirin superfamily)
LIAPLFIRHSAERGFAELGWLKSYHSFSFADYHDPKWMGFGPLRVINDDWIAPKMGFPMHPHRDMEIITCLLSGSLKHQDSMGNARVIHAGEFQYMAAGTGIQHSEWNPSDSEPCHLLQIWLQPDQKSVQPRYADGSFASASGPRWHLVASKTGRIQSIAIHQDADLWMARLAKDESAQHALSENRRAWIQVATGSVSVHGHSLKAGDAIAFKGPGVLHCETSSATELLLFDLP